MYLEQPDKDQNELEEKGLSEEDTDIVKDGRPSDNDYTRSTKESPDSTPASPADKEFSSEETESGNEERLKKEAGKDQAPSVNSEDASDLHNDSEVQLPITKENSSSDTDNEPLSEISEKTGEESETEKASEAPENISTRASGRKKSRKEGFSATVFDFVELVTVSLTIVMLLLTFVLRHSPVIGPSMNPTIEGSSKTGGETKDVLLISKMFYTPQRGDIVVLQTTNVEGTVQSSLNHPIVKRIIAVGGDTLVIDRANWKVTVTDSTGNVVYEEKGRESTSYVNYTDADMHEGYFIGMGNICTLEIPEGFVFVMGDNRNNSRDSRDIGFIDQRLIVGRSVLRIFPFDRFGTVS